jgi:hypothetical protein
MYVYTCVCMYVYMHVQENKPKMLRGHSVSMYVCMYVCMHVIRKHTNNCDAVSCSQTKQYLHACIHTYTHTHTYTYTHTHTSCGANRPQTNPQMYLLSVSRFSRHFPAKSRTKVNMGKPFYKPWRTLLASQNDQRCLKGALC